MATHGEEKHFYDFGPFRLDPQERALFRQGSMVALSPKVLEILMVLLRNGGHIVTKDRLMNEVWPDSFVEEANLNVQISALRKALGDTPDGHAYIETIPRRGYRFVAPIEAIADEPSELIVKRRTTRVVQEEEEINTDSPFEPDSLPPATPAHAAAPTSTTPSTNLAVQATVQPAVTKKWFSASKVATGLTLTALIVFGGLVLRQRQRQGASFRGRRVMLGVLPFADLSGEAGQEYLADGITEEMISQLGALNPSQLGVIARTSAMTYKHTNKDASQIGRELGVDYLVEGSIRRSGKRVRITAQLIQTTDQTHLWAASFDRDLGDILKLEEDVSHSIAREIRVQLKPHESVSSAETRPVNSEAYEDYLKGRFFANQRYRAGLDTSIEYYDHAVQKDPNFALAYAGLADSYLVLGLFSVRSVDVMPKAESAAARALELDRSLAEAHSSLAGVKALYYWDWAGAEREFTAAMNLDPDDSRVHHLYATQFCAPLGRNQEMIEHMERAVQLDPLSPIMATDLGWAYYLAGQRDRAMAQYQKARELDLHFVLVLDRMAQAYEQRGLYQEMLAINEQNASFPTDIAAAMRQGFQRAGYRAALQAQLEVMTRRKERGEASDPYSFAYVLAKLGQNDHALEQLEQAYTERYCGLIYMNVDHPFLTLRNDPRFQKLERRVGLIP